MKEIILALLIVVWCFVCIGGIILWEANTDMIQGLSIGIVATIGLAALLAQDTSEWKLTKHEKEYYIKW